MAKLKFNAGDLDKRMEKLRIAVSRYIGKKALYGGADIFADILKEETENIPDEVFRHLDKEEKFKSVAEKDKQHLVDAMGISEFYENGHIIEASVGFDGYQGIPTAKYPKGVPNALLARSINSGSSVRQRYPFIDDAVKKAAPKVEERMREITENEIDKIMKGSV